MWGRGPGRRDPKCIGRAQEPRAHATQQNKSVRPSPHTYCMVYMTVHWDGGSGSHCRPWLATKCWVCRTKKVAGWKIVWRCWTAWRCSCPCIGAWSVVHQTLPAARGVVLIGSNEDEDVSPSGSLLRCAQCANQANNQFVCNEWGSCWSAAHFCLNVTVAVLQLTTVISTSFFFVCVFCTRRYFACSFFCVFFLVFFVFCAGRYFACLFCFCFCFLRCYSTNGGITMQHICESHWIALTAGVGMLVAALILSTRTRFPAIQ